MGTVPSRIVERRFRREGGGVDKIAKEEEIRVMAWYGSGKGVRSAFC